MIFESFWPLAFLLAIPIVIILYLLVPKGKDTKISSNLLWEKLFENQQSKTFLEKFIHNLLMYLQIVILLLLVLALMSPYIKRQGNTSGSVVFVLDTSGSMQHLSSDGRTRIEEAVDEIKACIEATDDGKFSIVTNDGTGTNLLTVSTSDKQALYRVLDQISCTDTEGNLADAVTTVQTVCGDEEQKKASTVLLYTDGIGASGAEEFLGLLDANICVVGEAASNVAATFLSSSRDGDTTTVASGLMNYSDYEASLELSLYEGDTLLSIRKLTVSPQEAYTCLFEDVDWQGGALRTEISSVTFSGSEDGDSLAADNTVYALADSASQIQGVLIGEGNTYIEKAYLAVTGQNLAKAKEESSLNITDDTVVIYDADSVAKQKDTVSRMCYADATGSSNTLEKVSLSVSDTELTSGISQFAIGVNQTYVYDLPEWATGFLWSGTDCAGYYGEHDGIRQVVLGFDIRESDFALQAEYPVFMANALSYLGDSSLLAQTVYQAGDTVLFHPKADVDVNTIEASTDKAGIYEVHAGEQTEQYVVRFATGSQSDGRITAESSGSGVSYRGQLVQKQLRSILLLLVLLLMVIEWICYVRQMRYRGKFYLVVRLVGMAMLVLAVLGVTIPKSGADNTTVFLVDISTSNVSNLEQMEEDLRSLIAKMPDKNQYAVITFGKNSLVEEFLTSEKHFSGIMSTPDQTATNLEEAVSRGLAMIPENAAGRLVILSDGKETKGNITGTASALVSRQVELLSILYEVEQDKDAYIENVELPSYLYEGDSYSMTVSVVSNYDTDATLEIWKGSTRTGQSDVHLNKGTNQFVLKQKVTGDQAESFEVRVSAPEDTCAENDTFAAYAVVDNLPRVLVVSGMKEDSSRFSETLLAAGCNYQVVSALNAPDNLEEMLQYKSIILENVYRTDLPEGFLENVDTYVKDYGCGLICCGGEESYALGGYRNSELETVLPVDMQLRGVNELPTLAMIMVIDHSGSMSDIADAASGATNLDLAIQAADAAVDELREEDYVGVLTFDDTYTWQVSLVQASDKDSIHEKIQSVTDGGGTTIKPSLVEALKAIKKCEADVKHVVLLTDGQGETRYFSDVVSGYQEAGVTLSTVAVGMGSDTSLLQSLAEQCNGRYYYSDIATDIPKIFAQEVFLSGDTYLQNGTFSLAVNASHEITRGLYAAGWPSISGYVSATPKNSARVLIASEKDDPILSVMQYGLGHTVAWNTDVTNAWSGALAQSDDYVQLWKRIIDYSAGNAGLGEDSVDVVTAGGSTQITYRAQDYTETTAVEAVYTDPDGNTNTAKLTASAPGVYETTLDTDQIGIYNLSVRRMEDDEIENAMMTAAVVQYSDEYKFALTNDKFKAFVQQYGSLIEPKEDIWKKLTASSQATVELAKWLILFAILWFVMDIAFRRFCFRPQDTKAVQMLLTCWTDRRKKRMIASKETNVQKQEQSVSNSGTKPAKAVKTKKSRKSQNKQETTLDTSALLNKKNLRD